MNFYIASKLENYKQVQALAGLLKSAGWTHTYDWTAHGSVKFTSRERLQEVGQRELDGVRDADVVIILTPQGRGTHTEFGIAAALNKTVFLCHKDDTYFKLDDNTTSFYWLPNVVQFAGTTKEIAEAVLRHGKDKRYL